MDKPAQNIQDSFLNNARKEKGVITIYLLSGVKLSGRIKSFDKYSLVLETNNQEQLIFKHAISTVVTMRPMQRTHGPPREASTASAARPCYRQARRHNRPRVKATISLAQSAERPSSPALNAVAARLRRARPNLFANWPSSRRAPARRSWAESFQVAARTSMRPLCWATEKSRN